MALSIQLIMPAFEVYQGIRQAPNGLNEMCDRERVVKAARSRRQIFWASHDDFRFSKQMRSSLSSDHLGILVTGTSGKKLEHRRKYRAVLLTITAARLYQNRGSMMLSVSDLGPLSEGRPTIHYRASITCIIRNSSNTGRPMQVSL